MTTLRPADCEAVVVAALAEALPSVAVSTVASEAESQVVVDVTGGRRREHVIDVWTVALQAWGTSKPEASGLCSEALTALCNQVGYEHTSGAFISSVTDTSSAGSSRSLGLPVPFPDPDSRNPRYQVAVDVSLTQPDDDEPQEAA